MSIKFYAMFDERDVLVSVQSQADTLPAPPNTVEVSGPLAGEYYRSNGKILARHDYVLESLPLPCTVTIEGTTYHCIEQPVFEFDAPGTYSIQIRPDSVEFMEKEFIYDYQP